MKATEQYFPVVLFIMLYKVVLPLSLWMKSERVIIEMHESSLVILSLARTTVCFSAFYKMNLSIFFMDIDSRA